MNLKIKHLVMKDIGPFRGRHIISFEEDSNLNGYAFFGANGRGKTSIYNAMKWCLWGEVKTRVRASRGSKISGSLRPIVGSPDEDILMNREAYENEKIQSMSVIILAESKKGEIQISRTVESLTTLPRTDDDLRHELTVVFGTDSTSEQSKAQELIEKFFPRELQQFFFIDGEALEEYTDMMEKDSTLGLKDEIESVLRMPSMTRGIKNLENIRKNINKSLKSTINAQRDFSENEKKLRLKEKDEEESREKITSFEDRIAGRKIKIELIRKKMEKYKEMQTLFDELKLNKKELDSAEDQLKRSSEQRLDSFKDKAWKVMIWRRVEGIYDECEMEVEAANSIEYHIKRLESKIEKSLNELDELNDICSHCEQKIPNLEKYRLKKEAENEIDKKQLKKIKQGSTRSLDELKMRIGKLIAMKPGRTDEERIRKAEDYWKSDISKVKNLIEKIENIEKKITSEALENLGALGEQLGTQETLLRRLQIEKENLNSKHLLIINDVKKLKLKVNGKNKPNTSIENKIDQNIGKLIVTISDTMSNYREQARSLVEKNATEVFMQVTNAPATFAGIKLDNEFRAQIMLKSGRVATAPSSGMKSMMTISIIDSLRRVSMLNAPIFFDTPGRSLDVEHKKAQLNYFWRDHGSQFLIFAHSGEYEIDSTINDFGDKIAKAWELTWPGDHRNCLECDSENIMHNKRERKANCLECQYIWDTSVENTMIKELKIK